MKKLSILLLFVMLFPICLGCANGTAFAETNKYNNDFDDTYVLNDLQGATIGGKLFNVADYPKYEGGELRLLEFAEYSFSTRLSNQYNYGLYFYLYNPTGKKIENHQLNKIQLANTYNGNEPTAYKKYSLKLCSESADKLFYKFRVENVTDIFSRVVQTPSSRVYDISSIEVFYSGAVNAKDYKIGGTWVYTGFAKGCANESETASTLQSTSKALQTVTLDNLQFTYYRTWQNLACTWADQLTSVYFAVDEKLASLYDDLYSIQAETWKHLTSPIVSIYDRYIFGVNGLFIDYDKLYTNLLSQRGIDKNGDGVQLFWDYIYESTSATSYNANSQNNLKKLAWVFQVAEQEEWTVNSSRLLNYMQTYSATRDKTVQGKYSQDLFSNFYYDWWNDYKQFDTGYLEIDINCDDSFTLLGSNRKATFWDILTLGATFDRSESEPLTPIVALKYSDIQSLADSEISQKHYVALDDVLAFREYVRIASEQGKVTYLFHFDKSEYFTTPVTYGSWGVCGYLSQEPIYLDFDIISLGYRKDGTVNKIAVVNSPIDIATPIEGGQDIIDDIANLPDWAIYLIVGVAVLIVLIFGKYIVQLISFVIMLVVRIVTIPIEFFKGRKNK